MNPSRPSDRPSTGSRQVTPASAYQRNGPSKDNSLEEPGDNHTRAARFEDEKRRIIESCFTKKEADGVQAESYITHVRVVEDAQYPSSPPPPDSVASNKKKRVILVAVRRSGRVRVHKARENPMGTFSIGKTWHLDELSAIHDYPNFTPSNQQEMREKMWSGTTGFVVTLSKPYYWQASTAKEKEFFLASLIKIYRKYTGGKLPNLIGFPSFGIEQFTDSPGNRSNHDQNSAVTPTQRFSPPPAASPTTVSTTHATYAGSDIPRQNGLGIEQDRKPSWQSQQSEYRLVNQENQRPESQGTSTSQVQSLRDVSNAKREEPKTPTPFNFSVTQPQPNPSVPSSLRSGQVQTPTAGPRVGANALATVDKSYVDNGPGAKTSAPATQWSEPPIPVPAPLSMTKGNQFSKSTTSFHSSATTDTRSTSRPTTAGSQPTSDTGPTRLRPSEEPVPERKRPPIAEKFSFEQTGPPSESGSTFATPLATPTGLHGESQTLPALPVDSANGLKAAPVAPAEYFDSSSVPKQEPPGPTVTPAVPKSDVAEAKPESQAPLTSGPVAAEPEELPQTKEVEEAHRPGLGPMMKKKSSKDIANQFRKAALAANAFKPRAGGAGARLRALQDKPLTSDEPDGIHSVVPAPLLRGMSSESGRSATPEVPMPGFDGDRPMTPLPLTIPPKVQIQRTATEESIQPAVQHTRVEDISVNEPRPSSPDNGKSRSPQRRRRQRQEAELEKYCTSLGLDPRITEGRGADFNDLLTEFGWEGRLPEGKEIDVFESEIRRDIGRAEATGWLGHIEQQEGKVQELGKAFEKAIAECEELDGLLTLYSHELDTLQEDIEYIEAQSQGLQVMTANQKLLQSELDSLLRTLTMSPKDLASLQTASLATPDGVQTVERTLATLYKAMVTLDPETRQNRLRHRESTANPTGGGGAPVTAEIGNMLAVQQSKDIYQDQTMAFVGRFIQHMNSAFKAVEHRTSEENSRSATSSSTSLELKSLQAARQELWMYNAMLLFVREVNQYEWQTLITRYEMNVKDAYQEQFRESAMLHRRNVRTSSGEEQYALFTMHEKDKVEDSLATSAARKLTVRRSKKSKNPGAKESNHEKRDGKPDAWEVFSDVVRQQASVIAEEQNFVVHFFHLNSQSNADFAELITRSVDQRKLPNLHTKQAYDPDRNMAKIVLQVVDGIFAFWSNDIQGLMEWAIKVDPLQEVGVLCAIEQALGSYEETNQEYITRTLRAMHERLAGLFHKFVDDQIKAIEETKVKVKKRRGIISFMRTFPVFVAAVEDMIPAEFAHNQTPEVRFIINDAYSKLLKAMWESLNFIAKDDPSSSGGARTTAPNSGDPEDKEALNYHILLIENMNHYIEEVEEHSNIVLEEWKDRANRDMLQHLSQYTDAVLRRPLGKWLDFLESTEALMKQSENHAGIANRPSHSRSSAKKILSSYDAREVRKGVETLKKRIEKHFGEVDEASSSSGNLIRRVLEECGVKYAHAYDRMEIVLKRIYERKPGNRLEEGGGYWNVEEMTWGRIT